MPGQELKQDKNPEAGGHAGELLTCLLAPHNVVTFDCFHSSHLAGLTLGKNRKRVCINSGL